jgi:hypothetical protein
LLNRNGNSDSREDRRPQIITGQGDTLHAIWSAYENSDGGLFYARNSGSRWSSPMLLTTESKGVHPQIIEGHDGTLHAVWIGSDKDLGGPGPDNDIFYSANSGSGWSSPVLVNTNGVTDSDFDSDPQIMEDSGGTLHAVWQSAEELGGIPTTTDIFYATNSGSGWSAPSRLNTDGTAPEDGYDGNPQIMEDSSGTLHVVWESWEDLGGAGGVDSDIFYSTNSGSGWSYPVLLNSNGDSDSGYDDHPQIIEDASGILHVIWESSENLGGTAGNDYDIFYAVNSGSGWSYPVLLNTTGVSDSDHDYYPQIMEDDFGALHVVWESNDEMLYIGDVFYAVNYGSGWSSPALLNASGASDTREHARPQIAVDSCGTVHAVWQSNEDLGGAAGTDSDIFYARCIVTGGIGGRDYDNYFKAIPDFSDSSAWELATLGVNPLDASVRAEIVDSNTGVSVKDVWYGPTFAPLGLTVVPDVSGNGVPELCMMGYNPDNKKVLGHIRDAATDTLVRYVWFGASHYPIDMEVMDDLSGNDRAEVVLLGQSLINNKSVAKIHDALTGVRYNLVWYGPEFDPVSLTILPDISGNGASEVVLLGYHPANHKTLAHIRDSVTGDLVHYLWYGTSYYPVDMTAVPDIDDNGYSELALLGVNPNTGGAVVKIMDAYSRVVIRTTTYTGNYIPLAFEVLDDMNDNGKTEIAVLGLNRCNNKVCCQIRDAYTGNLIRNVMYGLPHIPHALTVIPDIDGSGYSELPVLTSHPTNGNILVKIRDAGAGTKLGNVYLDPMFHPWP